MIPEEEYMKRKDTPVFDDSLREAALKSMLLGETVRDYAEFVETVRKPFAQQQLDLVHMAMGLAGESGEVTDLIKKHWAYDKMLNESALREELGDVMFYVVGMLNVLGWTLEDILQENMTKLKLRYPKGYSDDDAIAQADKK